MALIGEMKYLTIGGNTYSIPEFDLPIASSSTLGGIKVGTNLEINSSTGVLSVTGIPTISITQNLTSGTEIGTISINGSSTKLYAPTPQGVIIDDALSTTSENPVQNKVINTALNAKYTKPNTGIPASDLASGVIPTVPSAYTSTPAMNGTGSAGSSGAWSRGDHVHPSDTSRVPTTRKVNGKALSADIVLGGDDISVEGGTLSGTLNSCLDTIDGDIEYVTGAIDGLATVATSGSYNDLNDKPTIPAAITVDNKLSTTSENPVQNKVITTALNTKYTKPSTGIPASDLASGVIPTVPSAATTSPKMDGTAAVGSSSKYAKEDHIHPTDTSRQATLVSGTNIKTINSTSLLGSGNIAITGLPSVTTSDNGKFLRVVSGAWAAQTVETLDGGTW